MNSMEKTQALFESLAKVNMNLESVLKIAGLNDLATSWVMFAYITPELDTQSFDKINSYMVRELVEKKLCGELAQRLVRIAIEERIQARILPQRTRAAIIGVSQCTYSKKRDRYEPGIQMACELIDRWEQQAKKVMLDYQK